MALTTEEQKDIDDMVAAFKKEMWGPRARSLALFFGLAGWVMFEHWHLVPAVIMWTLAGLVGLSSFSPPKS